MDSINGSNPIFILNSTNGSPKAQTSSKSSIQSGGVSPDVDLPMLPTLPSSSLSPILHLNDRENYRVVKNKHYNFVSIWIINYSK